MPVCRRLTSLGLSVLLSLVAALPARAACPSAEEQAWPSHSWPVASPAHPELVARFDALAFPPGQGNVEGPRTDGLVVVADGRLVYERYAEGFGPDQPHITWSVSKSVLQALYGTAVAEGLVDIDRPVAERSPWLGEGDKARITYRELLQMRSGLEFVEGYEYAPLLSDVLAMLYTLGRGDMAGFAASRPMAAAPGTAWAYKSGDSVILAAALRDLVGAERYADYPWSALFDPIGATSAVWERDARGTFVGSSYLYLTPRDLARIGLLYLRDGCWAGTKLLPEGWVAFAGTPSPALDGPGIYGAHWWLNRPGAKDPPALAQAPEDLLAATGHWGQKLLVLPSQRLVIARAANDRSGFDTGPFVAAAIAAFAP